MVNSLDPKIGCITFLLTIFSRLKIWESRKWSQKRLSSWTITHNLYSKICEETRDENLYVDQGVLRVQLDMFVPFIRVHLQIRLKTSSFTNNQHFISWRFVKSVIITKTNQKLCSFTLYSVTSSIAISNS